MKFKEFDKIAAEMRKTFVAKNNDYGDDSIGALGEKGIFARIWDKTWRLKRLVWDNRQRKVKDETLEDTYKDLAVYLIIAVILKRDKWK